MLPEELEMIIATAEESMDEAVEFCKKEFSHIRAGKASPALLDGVRVEYYGAQTPLNQLANVTAPEPRMLLVTPYDKSAIREIEKAIQSSGLGLNPGNDGSVIRVPLPLLTEERRRDLVKLARDVAEKTRVSIRNARRDANDLVRKTIQADSLPEDSRFEAEEATQKITDTHTQKVDELLAAKEKDIMTV